MKTMCLPVITTMALWQLNIYIIYIYILLYIYIYIYILFTKVIEIFWSRDVPDMWVLTHFELKIHKDF